MRLLLNHNRTQNELNRLSTAEFILSSDTPEDQTLEYVTIEHITPFLYLNLTPPQSIRHATVTLLHTRPNNYGIALFLDALSQGLITSKPEAAHSSNNCSNPSPSHRFSFPEDVSLMLHTQAYNHYMSLPQYIATLKPAHPPQDPQPPIVLESIHRQFYIAEVEGRPTRIYDSIKSTVIETIQLPTQILNYLNQITTDYRIVATRSKSKTGHAAAAIEAILKGWI